MIFACAAGTAFELAVRNEMTISFYPNQLGGSGAGAGEDALDIRRDALSESCVGSALAGDGSGHLENHVRVAVLCSRTSHENPCYRGNRNDFKGKWLARPERLELPTLGFEDRM